MAKKTCQIIRNTTRSDFDTIELGGRKKRFPANGLITTEDVGAAREVRAQYGTDVVVVEAEPTVMPGHHRFITSPGMPWHKYDEFGRRINMHKRA